MAGKRPRIRRAPSQASLVNVLTRDASGWKATRRVFLLEALRKIARREWTAVWFDDGELAGVDLEPPRQQAVMVIPCGSVECLRWWVERAQLRIMPKPEVVEQRSVSREVQLDFYGQGDYPEKRVSAKQALKKIALGEWKAIWYESGELAGVAAL